MTDQQQSRRNKEIGRQLAALFLTGQFGYVMGLQVAPLIEELRPAPAPPTAAWLAQMVSEGNLPGPLGVPDGPCQAIEREQSAGWLALYTVVAAMRLAESDEAASAVGQAASITAEERYFALHLVAEERRMRAAALQDMASLLNVDRQDEKHPLLGWRAVLDAKTTPECRYAHGRNYRADQMPAIGWPGAVHISCRCSPGPAIPGAPLLPSI